MNLKNSFVNNKMTKAKKSIIDKFLKILESKKYTQITISEICKEAAIDRTTFYLYFQDKYELFILCIYNLMFQIDQQARENTESTSIFDYYNNVFTIFINQLVNNEKRYRNISNNVEESFLFDNIKVFINLNLSKQINLMKKRNPNISYVPTDFLAEFFSGGFTSISRWWINKGQNYSKDELISYMKRITNSWSKVLINTFA